LTLSTTFGVGDVGTVINPRSLLAQINGGSCLGIAHALFQKLVSIRSYGCLARRRFHYSKPLTILDIPSTCRPSARTSPDPETPVGARGVGEPPVGAGLRRGAERDCGCRGRGCVPRAPVTADII
jgi:CO/xanthine dehydrogenase Mo-binding subunit